MKVKVLKPVEIEVASVVVDIPIRYPEDVAESLPGLHREMGATRWAAQVDIGTGKIELRDGLFPPGEYTLETKVCDEGTYLFCDSQGQPIVEVQDYVPSGIIPDGGDYVNLVIKDGVVTNWPSNPSEAFAELYSDTNVMGVRY